MKKSLLLLACATFALAANAQKVTFLYNGEPVEKNGTVISNEIEQTPYFSYMFEPNVSIKASANCDLYMTAKCTTGQEVQLCIGSCINGSDITSDYFSLTKDQVMKVDFHYESFEPISTVVSTDLTVMDANTDDPVNKLTVVYDPNASTVKLISNERNVNYSDGVLNFNAEGVAALYDATGKCVYKADVNGNGSVSTEGLAKGVYIYRIGNESGKILVK